MSLFQRRPSLVNRTELGCFLQGKIRSPIEVSSCVAVPVSSWLEIDSKSSAKLKKGIQPEVDRRPPPDTNLGVDGPQQCISLRRLLCFRHMFATNQYLTVNQGEEGYFAIVPRAAVYLAPRWQLKDLLSHSSLKDSDGLAASYLLRKANRRIGEELFFSIQDGYAATTILQPPDDDVANPNYWKKFRGMLKSYVDMSGGSRTQGTQPSSNGDETEKRKKMREDKFRPNVVCIVDSLPKLNSEQEDLIRENFSQPFNKKKLQDELLQLRSTKGGSPAATATRENEADSSSTASSSSEKFSAKSSVKGATQISHRALQEALRTAPSLMQQLRQRFEFDFFDPNCEDLTFHMYTPNLYPLVPLLGGGWELQMTRGREWWVQALTTKLFLASEDLDAIRPVESLVQDPELDMVEPFPNVVVRQLKQKRVMRSGDKDGNNTENLSPGSDSSPEAVPRRESKLVLWNLVTQRRATNEQVLFAVVRASCQSKEFLLKLCLDVFGTRHLTVGQKGMDAMVPFSLLRDCLMSHLQR